MKSLMRSESTIATRPVSTYKSGKVVQTTGATSQVTLKLHEISNEPNREGRNITLRTVYVMSLRSIALADNIYAGIAPSGNRYDCDRKDDRYANILLKCQHSLSCISTEHDTFDTTDNSAFFTFNYNRDKKRAEGILNALEQAISGSGGDPNYHASDKEKAKESARKAFER